jgi:hypothetical protein
MTSHYRISFLASLPGRREVLVIPRLEVEVIPGLKVQVISRPMVQMFDTAGAARQTNLAFLVEVKVIPDRTARDIHKGYPLKSDLRRGEEGKGRGPRLTFMVVRTSKRTTGQTKCTTNRDWARLAVCLLWTTIARPLSGVTNR